MLPDLELRVTDQVFSFPLCPAGGSHKTLFFAEIGENVKNLEIIGSRGSITTSPCPDCHFSLKVDFYVRDRKTTGWKSLSPIVELVSSQ